MMSGVEFCATFKITLCLADTCEALKVKNVSATSTIKVNPARNICPRVKLIEEVCDLKGFFFTLSYSYIKGGG